MTSSSLWMLSGILAMLKRDGFNPSTPGLFKTAIALCPPRWRCRIVQRPRDRCSFALSVGSPSWRIQRSRFLSRRNALLWSPLAPPRVCLRSLSSTWLRTRLRRTHWFPPHWRFPRLCPRVRGRCLSPLLLLFSPVRRVFVLLVRLSGRGSALSRRLVLATASVSRGVRGRLLLRNLWVFTSRSRPLA